MKAVTDAWRWSFSLQNILLLIAISIGALAMAYNSSSLINGLMLIWENSGYSSLALGPLTLLLASAMLKDVTDRNADRNVLDRQYAIVASIAPMAGFLGTVLGVMNAIQSLGGAENAESLIEMVGQTFDSMAIAFTTTAWGLVLAMIAILIMRVKKKKAEASPQQQLESITFLLREIASGINDMRPIVRREQIEDQHNGGNNYESIQL